MPSLHYLLDTRNANSSDCLQKTLLIIFYNSDESIKIWEYAKLSLLKAGVKSWLRVSGNDMCYG